MKTPTPINNKNKVRTPQSNYSNSNHNILHTNNLSNQVNLEESLVDLYLSVKIRKQEEVSNYISIT